MLEVLFVNTIFSLGAVQWQNQKDGLSGNKSAYLVSLAENSTQNEDLKLKWKHFNKNRKKSCLFICFVFLWGEHPKLINQLVPLVGISKQSITRQMGLCFQWNRIWGDWKLICFHLFRKCVTHLHKGSKKKQTFGHEWQSFFGRRHHLNNREKGETDWTPVFPTFFICGTAMEPRSPRELEQSLLIRWAELPSTPSLSVKERKFQRLSIIKTEKKIHHSCQDESHLIILSSLSLQAVFVKNACVRAL